jgi:hypothetical protein
MLSNYGSIYQWFICVVELMLQEKNISVQELSDRLNWDIQELLTGEKSLTLLDMTKVSNALGFKIDVNLIPNDPQTRINRLLEAVKKDDSFFTHLLDCFSIEDNLAVCDVFKMSNNTIRYLLRKVIELGYTPMWEGKIKG